MTINSDVTRDKFHMPVALALVGVQPAASSVFARVR